MRSGMSLFDRQNSVQNVCDRRAELLKSSGLAASFPRSMPAGKLLLYAPDVNLFDGAAEDATRGFFDLDNVPPCDFWIAYVVQREPKRKFDSFLICWIPGALVDLVDSGIRANPEECIVWAGPDLMESMRGLFQNPGSHSGSQDKDSGE